MPTNDFLPFARGAGANILTPAAFNPTPTRQTGFQDGIADPAQANTVLGQAQFVASMIAQFISDTLAQNVVDNGNLTTLEGQFIAAIQSSVGTVPQAALWHFGRDVGAADLLNVTASPIITAYADGMVVSTIVLHTALTTTPHMSANGLASVVIVNADGTALTPGEIQGGNLVALLYDSVGAQWRLVGNVSVPQASLIHRAADNGSANAMVCPTIIPSVVSVTDGMLFWIKKSNVGNNAATTLSIAGTTAPLTWGDGTAFTGSEIPANADALIGFDNASGGSYRLLGSPTPAQTILQAGRDYFVDPAGSDSNDGLSSGAAHAFLTIQKAISSVASFNLNGFSVTIHVAAGTYAGPVNLTPAYGSGNIFVTGSGVGSCNVASTLGSAWIANAGSQYTLTGFNSSSSAPNNSTADLGAGVYCWGSGTQVKLGVMKFGACQGAHMTGLKGGLLVLQSGGAITLSGGLTANTWGNGAVMLGVGGEITCQPPTYPSLTITGGITVAYFAEALDNSELDMVFASITGASFVAGQKYLAVRGGGIQTLGGGINYLPGNVAGVATAPGWYG